MEDQQFDYITSYKEELIDSFNGNDKNFDLQMLFALIFRKLHPLFLIDCGTLSLYDNELEKIAKTYVSESSLSGDINCKEVLSNPVPFCEIKAEIAAFEFPVLKSRDNWIEGFGKNHCPHSQGNDYQFHCYIPLEIDNKILGTLALHNLKKELSAEGLVFCCNIADLLAELVLIMNKTPKRAVKDTSSIDYSVLLSLSNAMATVKNKKDFLKVLSQQFKPFPFLSGGMIATINPDRICYNGFLIGEQTEPFPLSRVLPDINELLKLEPVPAYVQLWNSKNNNNIIGLTLQHAGEVTGALYLPVKDLSTLTKDELDLMNAVASQLSVAWANVLAQDKIRVQALEITACRQQLEEHTIYLQEEIQVPNRYNDIIGEGKEMQQIFNLLNNVSGSETTVLILGETGTGKELIARAIHHDSDRKDKLMVKVNCAAIPPNLIESELFGHEKGSFTGATERRIGKFELANKSTLFLDEIGELSLELQVKLLRVLQEKEIERVGGKTTISTDVRIVSATNRNLLEEVEAGRFRSDLFYRLNVFPVSLPPLRKRKEDIPLLASHFLSRFTIKSGKKIDGFSQKTLSDMMKYHWPGNVRELEHLIERQVLLTKGPIIKSLEFPSENKVVTTDGTVVTEVKTILENERDHIFEVLKMCNGKISGKDGAARLLAVPATTLNSKIKKLGLSRKHVL